MEDELAAAKSKLAEPIVDIQVCLVEGFNIDTDKAVSSLSVTLNV